MSKERDSFHNFKDRCLFSLDSFFEYKTVLDTHELKFYQMYFTINNDEIQYTSIVKVSKYNIGLRIELINKTVLDIPCDREIKRNIFHMFKSLNENAGPVDLKEIIGSAVLQFGGHNFLIYMRSTSYEDFRKLVLQRVAFYFYPHYNSKIVLDQFRSFKFYVRDQNMLIPLENSSDLGSALFHFHNRLCIYIKHEKNKRY